MAVLELKPHRLSYLVTSPGYEDDNGDYHEGTSRWEGDIECDAVPASGSANEITFDDGTAHKYSYTVYLPVSCKDFSVGERVRIRHLGNVEREYSVKGFQRWQLQCKLWV